MPPLLQIIGLALIVIAGLIHVLIFTIESLAWRSHRTWRQFGIASERDAEVARPWAFNQGFYNLFLAVGAIAGGIGGSLGGLPWAAVATFAALSMVAAAAVLLASSRGRFLRGALAQGLVPLLGVVVLGVGSL